MVVFYHQTRTMMKLYTTFCALLICFCTNAQENDLSKVADIQLNGRWVKMLANEGVEVPLFFPMYKSSFGLDDSYDLELVRTSADELGFVHYRYQLVYEGIPVEGAEYILHAQNGRVLHGNGQLVKNIAVPTNPAISSGFAIEASKTHLGAARYYWEMPEMEERIKHIKKDPNASFLPTPELVLADPQYGDKGSEYALAWKVDMFADGPQGHKTVFVDAMNGSVMYVLNGDHEGSTEGTAETRYHGTQTIITDSISPLK